MIGSELSERVDRPRIWIVEPAPIRPVPGVMIAPGARGLGVAARFGAADWARAVPASMVATELPSERRVSAPAVPVTTTSSRENGAGAIAKSAGAGWPAGTGVGGRAGG